MIQVSPGLTPNLRWTFATVGQSSKFSRLVIVILGIFACYNVFPGNKLPSIVPFHLPAPGLRIGGTSQT